MISWLAYRLAETAVRVLPPEMADRLAIQLARLAFAVGLPARRAVERNLEPLIPGDAPLRRRHARQSFEQFALAFVDFLRLEPLEPGGSEPGVEWVGEEHLESALLSRRGVIVLSAHLGSWERGAAILAHRGAPLWIAARAHASERVEALFARRRGALGVTRLTGRPLWLSAASALRRREWVALMGDRTAPGQRHSMCAWAAALARRTGALVLPAVMVRNAEQRWSLCIEPPLTPEACAGGGYRAVMMLYLKRYPGQWCAFEPLVEGPA
jgi:KDO2-lipid IV(A) lauroyltransferase